MKEYQTFQVKVTPFDYQKIGSNVNTTICSEHKIKPKPLILTKKCKAGQNIKNRLYDKELDKVLIDCDKYEEDLTSEIKRNE